MYARSFKSNRCTWSNSCYLAELDNRWFHDEWNINLILISFCPPNSLIFSSARWFHLSSLSRLLFIPRCFGQSLFPPEMKGRSGQPSLRVQNNCSFNSSVARSAHRAIELTYSIRHIQGISPPSEHLLSLFQGNLYVCICQTWRTLHKHIMSVCHGSVTTFDHNIAY